MMKDEKGQALPLAIMALTIGMLLIAPFLGHASASVIGSRTFNDAIAYRDAGDAGVEHAIWRLVYNSLGTSIPNVGNQITYSLPEALNGVTPSVTVTTNATGSGGATGNITKSILDTLVFDASGGYTPNIIAVNSGLCAVAYRGGSNKGYAVTATVSSTGSISDSVIASLAVDTSQCYEPAIVYVTGNIYAIAYRAASNRGYLKTFTINTNGTFGSIIDTLQFDTTCYEPSVVQVTSTIYAIAYRGSSNHIYLKTASIASDGTIGNTVISTATVDSGTCYTPTMVQVASTVYAIGYRGSSNRGYLKTYTISTSGTITSTAIDSLTFDSSACYEPKIINVATNYYAIAYRGPSNQGKLVTVSITSAGAIGNSVTSTLIFDTATGYEPEIIKVSGNVSVIAYRNSTNKGYLKTVNIASTGLKVIDSYNFETSYCATPSIVCMTGNIFAIAYLGTNNYGYLVTIGIATGGSGNPKYKIVATAGDTSIQAYVTISGSTASITSWKIQ